MAFGPLQALLTAQVGAPSRGSEASKGRPDPLGQGSVIATLPQLALPGKMGAKAVFVVQKCVVQKNQGCLGLFLEKSAPPQLEAGQQADRTDGSSRLMRWPAATKARQSPAISRW
jgi:hypothetical protein